MERMKFLTVTSEGKYWPRWSLCCLHLQIPSHQGPQSGSSHHHHNCTPDFPLALQVKDNRQVKKREKHFTYIREQMCQFGNSKCCNLWFMYKINITFLQHRLYKCLKYTSNIFSILFRSFIWTIARASPSIHRWINRGDEVKSINQSKNSGLTKHFFLVIIFTNTNVCN